MPTNIGPHLLGRRPSPPDSRDFRMAGVVSSGQPRSFSGLWIRLRVALGSQPQTRTTKVWSVAKTLDQGDTPHCVGFSAAGWGIADPVNDDWTDSDGHALYYECKQLDGEPGAETGSYVRTVAKVLTARGRMGSYYFAESVDDVRAWIHTEGPVIFGTDWLEGMFRINRAGYVSVTGENLGGHAYLCIGDIVEEDAALFQNSWSIAWGDQGKFKMKWSDVARLLAQQGEACAGLEQPLA